jgi:hypothetical protein
LGKMSNGIIQTTNRAQGQSDVVVENGNPIFKAIALPIKSTATSLRPVWWATTPRRCKLSTWFGSMARISL